MLAGTHGRMKEIILAAACLVGIVVVWDRARRYGLAVAWQRPMLVIALSIPIAVNFQIRSVYLDARMILALFIGFMFLTRPPHFLANLRPVAADFALLILIVSFISSEFANRTVTPFGFAQVLLQWLPPYALGRLFVTESRDLRHFMGPVCGAAVLWSFLSVVEGLTHVNLWQKIAGIQMDYDITEIRLGMKRAYGSQAHPISWGVTLALMLPVMIEAARLAKRGEGQKWWIAAPWLMIPGYLACGSRAVQMMAALIVVANLYYLFPRARAGILWAFLALTFAFFAFRAEVVELVSSTVDDIKNPEYIVINGEIHPYSGTTHRDLLFLVYKDAIVEAGLLGFGNPLQNVPLDPYVDARFISVDNHFLHCYLHNGVLGLVFFFAFFACVVANLIVVVVRGGADLGLALTLFGAFAGMFITFRTVWLDMNFGWFFIFMCGVAGTLANATLNRAAAGPYHQPHVES